MSLFENPLKRLADFESLEEYENYLEMIKTTLP